MCIFTQHEEGGRHIDADELEAEVHEEAEGREAGEGGGDDTGEAYPGLGPHPVAHHDGAHAEHHNDHDRHHEVRYHRVGVVLQLSLERAGYEPGHVDAAKVPIL